MSIENAIIFWVGLGAGAVAHCSLLRFITRPE